MFSIPFNIVLFFSPVLSHEFFKPIFVFIGQREHFWLKKSFERACVPLLSYHNRFLTFYLTISCNYAYSHTPPIITLFLKTFNVTILFDMLFLYFMILDFVIFYFVVSLFFLSQFFIRILNFLLNLLNIFDFEPKIAAKLLNRSFVLQNFRIAKKSGNLFQHTESTFSSC